MNIYIMVDIEGISGIYCRDQLTSGGRLEEGKRMFTREINICAEACKKYGADKVYVRDCHGGSSSLIWEKLSPAVDYAVCGMTGENRFVGLEDCDAVILLGYHAMAGTSSAVLEHTMSSRGIQNFYINGERVGEIAIDAAISGELGRPVIMVSGDDKTCREAKAFLPWAATAEVKRAVSCDGAVLLPPHTAEKVIDEAVCQAMTTLKNNEAKLYKVASPVTVRIERPERVDVPSKAVRPYMNIIDSRTFEVVSDTAADAVNKALLS